MSRSEKVTYIITAIQVLQKKGVEFAKSPDDYITAVDNRLIDAPDLVSADVTNILASIIYEQEPQNRDALDQIMKKPEVKK